MKNARLRCNHCGLPLDEERAHKVVVQGFVFFFHKQCVQEFEDEGG